MQQTHGEAEAFIRALTVYSGLVKFELTDDICRFYLDSLRPYGLTEATGALIKLARDAKVGRGLPSINDLLTIVAPSEVVKLDDTDEAALVSGRIWECIERFGSQRASEGFPRQREFIGELGWAVVGASWAMICDETQNKDKTTLKAQWRSEVKATMARLKAGMSLAPGLPSSSSHEQSKGRALIESAVSKAVGELESRSSRTGEAGEGDDW